MRRDMQLEAAARANQQANQALMRMQGQHAALYEQQLGSKSKLGALLDYIPPARQGVRRGQLDYLDVAVAWKTKDKQSDMMREAFRHIVLQFRQGIVPCRC